MAQTEKKSGLLRRTSSSKKPLKEKVVLMYDEIFAVSCYYHFPDAVPEAVFILLIKSNNNKNNNLSVKGIGKS